MNWFRNYTISQWNATSVIALVECDLDRIKYVEANVQTRDHQGFEILVHPHWNISIVVGGGLPIFDLPKNIMTATFGVVGL